MPRALNEFEKRDRLIEKAAEREASVSTASAVTTNPQGSGTANARASRGAQRAWPSASHH